MVEMSRVERLIQAGTIRHHDASIFIRVDKHGRNVGLLVVDADGERHTYTIGPHPTELGRVAMMED